MDVVASPGTTTAHQCMQCPAGHTCSNGEKTACADGWVAAAGTSNCVMCAEHSQYSNAPAATCKTCPAASYTAGGTAPVEIVWNGWLEVDGAAAVSCAGDCDTDSDCAGDSTCVHNTNCVSDDGVNTCQRPAGCYGDMGHEGPTIYALQGETAPPDYRDYCSNAVKVPHTQCNACEAGFMCDGSGARVTCDAGSVSNALANTCTPCAGVMWQDQAGQSTCKSCLSAHQWNGEDSAGQVDAANKACHPCLAGHACDGTFEPTECEAGFHSEKFNDQCEPCVGATWQDLKGQAECKSCLTEHQWGGNDSAGFVDSDRKTCTKCPAGYECNGITKTVCGAGFYSEEGNDQCEPCVGAMWQNLEGQAECKSCLTEHQWNGDNSAGFVNSDHTQCSK